MAVRIYTLAKELQLDSKLLVDLCTKAGVTGKGSALASLTEEEVDRVKAFVASGGKAAIKEVAASVATIAAAAPPSDAPIRREDYIAPGGVTGNRPPVLGQKPAADKPKDKGPGDAPRRPPEQKPPLRPAIRVARLPAASQPPPPSAPSEPAPQKPDIKLPIDAIRATKAGSATPLQAHMRKHEATKQKPQAAPPQGRGPGRGGPPSRPGMPLPPLPVEGKESRRRVGGPPAKGGAPGGEEFDNSLGGREARRLARKRTGDTTPTAGGGAKAISLNEDDRPRRRGRPKLKRTGVNTAAPRKGKMVIQLPCTVRSFSENVGVRASQVLGKLLTLGQMANINTDLTGEMVELLAIELGADVEIRQAIDPEMIMLEAVRVYEDTPENMHTRPPVVTFLGHVDHGKTSLLDRIIGTKLVKGESGGITQHIRAYKIEKDGKPITFVDTPGHEAFTEMRARGANVTDIAVLVVAADDGVMPQTEEAISHARAANVPIVVALNKVDLPGINFDRIYTQLVTNEVQPTEWGGDVELVRCSAQTGDGIDKLLDTLLTIAELHDYKANPNRPAYGTCLESELNVERGVKAKLLVQNGTLKVGDIIVCGEAHGRIKALYDTLDPRKTYDEVGPSTPVNITGLDLAPGAGDHFYVMDDIAKAREIAEQRRVLNRQNVLGHITTHVTLETLHDRLASTETQTLNLILRADARGSIEAIRKELAKLEHPEVQIKILQATVGGVSEADVYLADASDAIIIAFNVVPDSKANSLAQDRGVQIRRYDIIYRVTEELRASLEGMLKPEKREVDLGRALVQRTFVISRIGTIAGCRVISGTIERNSRVRVIRDSRIIGEYGLDSLKREKDDAREVREGLECGMKLSGFNDLKEGDVLEAYRVEEVARTL